MTETVFPYSNFFVTIRAAGERTEQECLRIIEEQAGPAEISVIRENPFKKALEQCFREGIQSEKKWLITVDADMMLLPGAIHLMIREAEKMPENYLQLQGKILDKITGTIRKAGPRIYRISLLPKLLELSESYEDHIRPESRIIKIFGDKGHPSRYIAAVTCLHDYEQFYKDVYRKTYVHAVKHPELLPEMMKTSVQEKENDGDYKVMLQAMWDGLTQKMHVAIDTRLFEKKAEEALKQLGLKEKPLFSGDINLQTALPDSVRTPQNLLKQSLIPYNDQPPARLGLPQKIFSGGFRGFLHKIGSVLIKTGKKIQMD